MKPATGMLGTPSSRQAHAKARLAPALHTRGAKMRHGLRALSPGVSYDRLSGKRPEIVYAMQYLNKVNKKAWMGVPKICNIRKPSEASESQ